MFRRTFLKTVIAVAGLGPLFSAGGAIRTAKRRLCNRRTHWIGPHGRWDDPRMWTNGVPNEKTDVWIEPAGAARAICEIPEDCEAVACNLTVGGGEIEFHDRYNNLHIIENLTIETSCVYIRLG